MTTRHTAKALNRLRPSPSASEKLHAMPRWRSGSDRRDWSANMRGLRILLVSEKRSAMLNGEVLSGKFSLEVAMKSHWVLAGLVAFAASGLAVALAGGGGNFDHLSDADRKVFQERFTKEIWPLLERN